MMRQLNVVETIGLRLTDEIDALRIDANRAINEHHRAEFGQFFTPAAVARLMSSMLTIDDEEISLLDAGAGIGSLLSAVVEVLCSRLKPPTRIHVTAYEIDPILIPYLTQTLRLCEDLCQRSSIAFSHEIIKEDFIEHTVHQLTSPIFLSAQRSYNCAIINPPYRKIQMGSLHRRLLSRADIETSNLYAGFISLVIRIMNDLGQIIAITPRSFCNGPYFQSFRNTLLDQLHFIQFHVFESREYAFQDNDVLQENVIFSAIKSNIQPLNVVVTSSADSSDEMIRMRKIPYDKFVHPNDPHRFIHLLSDELGEHVAEQTSKFSHSLDSLGLSISTGRVVDFRSSEFLRSEPSADTVPLIYPFHLSGSVISWPKIPSKKPNAIMNVRETTHLLLPNEYYVLVKRFSSNEERRRVVATVYDPTLFDVPAIAFENHLNYIHANGRGIDRRIAFGIAAFLNSTLVDMYFRQFNGHTQVNATDLRTLRYPSLEELSSLGDQISEHPQTQQDIDTIVARELKIMNNPDQFDPVQAQQRLTEALILLRELGLPKAQHNERSALTLLALLNLTPVLPWAEASNPLCGITPMMEFFAKHYGKHYKPNTRETVRRQTVHQFLDAGLIVANPDEPTRPITSPKAVYQIERSTLELLQMYGTPQWEASLKTFTETIGTLKQRYAQERLLQRIPITLPGDVTLRLSPSGQNVLVKQIIDEFASRFTSNGEVIYIGDTDAKLAYFAEERLRELGVTIDQHGKMPDVVIYYGERNWLVLIEAVTSHGPIDPKRRGELAYLFRMTRVGLVYVTAFLTRQAMKEYLPMLSWSTEVWVADAPDHLIHFNGDRFLGPYETKHEDM